MITHNECIWIGVDWGDRAHTGCAVDTAGAVVLEKTVPHSVQGLRELVNSFSVLGKIGGAAIEDAQGLVAEALLAAGWPVYGINPKLSCAWRKAWSVSAAKSDSRDARVLADGLRQHHARLQPTRPASAEMRSLALLCEDERQFIGQRTALVLRLQATLKRYFPEALAWFDEMKRLTMPG